MCGSCSLIPFVSLYLYVVYEYMCAVHVLCMCVDLLPRTRSPCFTEENILVPEELDMAASYGTRYLQMQGILANDATP